MPCAALRSACLSADADPDRTSSAPITPVGKGEKQENAIKFGLCRTLQCAAPARIDNQIKVYFWIQNDIIIISLN